MILSLLSALLAPQLPVLEQNRRMAAYTRLPVRPCEAAITPRDAIWTAAQAEGRPVTGCFELTVQAVGDDRDGVYLNSERDYRDPRNVTVRLTHAGARDLRDALGGATLGDALVGKPLTVDGTVVRQRILFTSGGRPTGRYYYQTHVRVGDVRQIARPIPSPF
jgi:hypothetical protein